MAGYPLPQKTIDERRKFVETFGLDTEKIISHMYRYLPPVKTMKNSIRYITEDLGFNLKIIEICPKLLGVSVNNMQKKIKYLTEDLGFSIRCFRKAPRIWGLFSTNRLKKGVRYITEDLKLPLKTLSLSPNILGLSKENLKIKLNI